MPKTTETEIETALKETQYLLKRWEYSVSSTDLLWIAPTKQQLSPEELAGMLQLLGKGCNGELPRTIKLDLGGVKVVGEQWTLVETLIVDFAKAIQAEVRIVGGGCTPAYSIIFNRRMIDSPVTAGGSPEIAKTMFNSVNVAGTVPIDTGNG